MVEVVGGGYRWGNSWLGVGVWSNGREGIGRRLDREGQPLDL